jgi:integrase
MPRQIRDANLETRTGRSRLKVSHQPYYRLLEPGLHLGYRKLSSGPGKWVVRRYRGDGGYTRENLRTADGALIIADDFAEADDVGILTFAQAQAAARIKPGQRVGPYTVADACHDYIEQLRSHGKSEYAIRDARYRIEALILPALGDVKVAALTAKRLKKWRDGIAAEGARRRTAEGQTQRHAAATTEDAKRARRATANRCWTILRAALNRAFRDGDVESDLAWRKVEPFKKVEVSRMRYITVTEAQRLINASDLEFRPLVQAALQTGARYGELIRLRVSDFNPDADTLTIRQSKSGNARHIVLTEEGAELFRQLCAGRGGGELIVQRNGGGAFSKSSQIRPMIAACERAKISPRISFHILRHTWASLAVMGGVPLMVVARNLGHADTRMVEKHYGHLAPSYVADEIRKGAPRFELAPSNVKQMRKAP